MSQEDSGPRINLETLRENISHRMIDLGIRSRPVLAQKAGVSKDTLDNLWKEKRKAFPYGDDLFRIAQALECSVEELVTGQKAQRLEDDALAESVKTRNSLREIVAELNLMNDEDLDRMKYALYAAKAMMGSSDNGKRQNAAGGE